MKKTIFLAVAIVAMCLISCDSETKQSDNNNTPATTETLKTEKATENVDSKGDIPEGLTGDLEKDAQIIVDASLAMSTQMTEGTDQKADKDRVQKLMDAGKVYYAQQGKTDEFAAKINEKMTKGITELASKMQKADKK